MGLFSIGLGIGAGAVGGIAQAAGGALRGAGEAIGGGLKGLGEAVGGALREPDVTINQMGLVGSAGQQSVKVVTGGGTLPARKTASKPTVNSKMPTEKLLQIAVGYLESIDSSLKQQMDFQVQTSREQAQAQKEAEIEGKSNRFSEYADRFKAGVGNKVDAVKNTAMNAGAGLLKIAGIGAAMAAALKLGSMDTKELDALKKNIDSFQERFGWIEEIAAAGGMGAWLFGPRGAMIAMAGDIVWQGLRKLGLAPNSVGGTAVAGAMGYGAFRAGRAAFKLTPYSKNFVGNKFNSARSGLSIAKNTAGVVNSGTTFRFNGARVGSTAKFFASPKWRNFMAWLAKKGKQKLVKKIETRIAIAIGSAAVAATGAGAVFGAIGILLDIGLSLWLVYEVYELWKQWNAESEAESVGAGDKDISDAAKENGPAAAATGTPAATKLADAANDNAQAIPQTAYDIVWANGAYGDPQRDAGKLLTQMTVDEVLDFQKNVLAPTTKAKQGTVHTPVGAYQFVYGTLKGYRDSGVVSGSDIFNAQTQDKLAENLWNSSRSGDMSKTWAYTFGSSPGQFANTSFESVKDKIISNEVGGYVGMTPSGPASQNAENKSILSQSIDTIADVVKGIASLVNTKSTPISGGVAAISKANAGNEYVDRIQNQVASKENALRTDIIQKQNDMQEPTARSAASLQIASANVSNEYADRIQNQAVSDEAALRGADQKQKDKQESAGRSTTGQRIAAANGGKMETLDPNYQVDPSNVISQYFIHFGLDA